MSDLSPDTFCTHLYVKVHLHKNELIKIPLENVRANFMCFNLNKPEREVPQPYTCPYKFLPYTCP